MNVVEKSEVVSDKASSGFDKYWQIFVGEKNSNYYTFTRSWQVRDGGEKYNEREAVPQQVFGKNTGKANATSDLEQAISEMNSKYTLKAHKATTELRKFMLCLAYDERTKKNIKYFPYAIVQKKIDGVASKYDINNKFYSRGLKKFKGGDSLTKHLEFDCGDNFVLQGEFVLPAPYKLEDVIRAITNGKSDNNIYHLLEFHIYNIEILDSPDMPYIERRTILEEVMKSAPLGVKLLPVTHVHSEKEYDAFHEKMMDEGEEGSVIYNIEAPYRDGKHNGLLKRKDWEEAEFDCLDIISGVGIYEECAIFVLDDGTGNGSTFNAVYKGDFAHRQRYFTDKKHIIGSPVTVKFVKNQETNTGKKKFANVIAVRNYE